MMKRFCLSIRKGHCPSPFKGEKICSVIRYEACFKTFFSKLGCITWRLNTAKEIVLGDQAVLFNVYPTMCLNVQTFLILLSTNETCLKCNLCHEDNQSHMSSVSVMLTVTNWPKLTKFSVMTI